ncbi:MAG: hydrogenase maturation nickel metallochaperone HypA [Spirochaetes bacterium]|nr:hydrogenase maturation nickel metallochaperone HypA [Spirochaetota bacterium]
MHELSIITNIFKKIEEVAENNSLIKINKVKLKIGIMRQVIPEFLRFAFEAVSKDTKAEKAELEIEYIPIKMKCNSCANEFIVENNIYICPLCNNTKLDILSGQEIILQSIDGDQ